MAKSLVDGLKRVLYLYDNDVFFYYRGISSTLLMVPEQAFLLEMVLVWEKGEQLPG